MNQAQQIYKYYFKIFMITIFIVTVFSMPAYANMMIFGGVYGLAGVEVLLFIPTIIIECMVINKMLEEVDKNTLFKGVIIIHFISYPIMVICGFYISVLAEIIPITLEYYFYKRWFNRLGRKVVDAVIPTNQQIWRACLWANFVTFIIGLGISIAIYINSPEHPRARIEKAQMNIAGLETALKLYYLDNGAYPSMEQGLQALVVRPEDAKQRRKGGYLEKGKIPKDPWGNNYVYLYPGNQGAFYIISYGADGKPGGIGKDKDIDNRAHK